MFWQRADSVATLAAVPTSEQLALEVRAGKASRAVLAADDAR
jgi:hypothetical protein